jgi:hypothetical protein
VSITCRLAPEIPSETREASATFTDFDEGIAACVVYACQHPIVAVRMFVRLSESQLFVHHYTVFEVKVPTLDPVSGAEVRWHLKTLPLLVKQVLGYLGLPEAVYTRLVINSG